MEAGPDYIQFYPTLRCDRSCGFCFNRSLPSSGDMQLRDFERMLDRIPASVNTIDIMGGEPSLHPDIVRMVRNALSSGRAVNVSSNGSRPDVLDRMGQLEGSVTIGLSINDRETLHRLRGFIQAASSVVKTVHSRDLDAVLVQDILSAAPRRFYLIYRDATAAADLGETVPFPVYLDFVSRFPADRVGTVFCSGFLPDVERYPQLDSVRCPAGTTKLGAMPDGSVYPCNLFFGRKEFMLGNILTDPFQKLWEHKTLSLFRRFNGNRCSRPNCPLHAACHGGCPAQSLMATGDVAAPDPRCAVSSISEKNLVY
jgi:radical SAM protein with 4Fe4S-binding SPASM domain